MSFYYSLIVYHNLFEQSELMGRTKKTLGEDVLYLPVLVVEQAFDPKGRQTVIIVNNS